MKKQGSVTVFLSLSLSILTCFILFINQLCIHNKEKLWFEIVTDVAMNSVLGEYNKELADEYDLYYIDASYLNKQPSEDNITERILGYYEKNTDENYDKDHFGWGRARAEDIDILDMQSAVTQNGSSLRNQAVKFISDSESKKGYLDCVRSNALKLTDFRNLEEGSSFEEWDALMSMIAGKKLPVLEDEESGIEKEVKLDNPADAVYSSGSDNILFASGMGSDFAVNLNIPVKSLISSRMKENQNNMSGLFDDSKEYFTAYLLDKMGNCLNTKDHAVKYELEYVIAGNEREIDNIISCVNRIAKVRMNDNVNVAMTTGIYEEAYALAAALTVCTLDPTFTEPVAKSIVYAVAYLETVGDIHILLTGGKVELKKDRLRTGIVNVLNSSPVYGIGYSGLSYKDYLVCMILLEDDGILNQRCMDMIEAQIRIKNANPSFMMDWCVERLKVDIKGKGTGPGRYRIRRTYGYF